MAQLNNRPLVWWKLKDRAPDVLLKLAFCMDFRRIGLLIAKFTLKLLIKLCFPSFAFLRLEVIVAKVHGHSSDPWAKSSLRIKRAEALECAQKRLLGEIFRLTSLTAEPEAGIKHLRLVAANEFPISISLALSRAQYQGTVRGILHSY
jgi:hypothetical protein